MAATSSAVQRAEVAIDEYRLLVDSVKDYAIFMLDPTGHIATWNPGAQRIKGYSANEIIGQHFSRFYTEEEVQAGVCEDELVIAARDGRFEAEGIRVRKDGTTFWANVIITAMREPSGELRGFAKVTRDLTERKRSEEITRELIREQAAREAAEVAENRIRDSQDRYRELSERLQVILEGIGDGITVEDASGRLLYANSNAARLCGFQTVSEMLTAPREQLAARFEIRDEHGEPFVTASLPSRRIFAGEQPEEILMHVHDLETGRRWWTAVRSTPVRNESGRPTLAVTIWHDVTAARRQDEAARYLDAATTTLSASLDHDSTLSGLAKALVPGLADWCTVKLLEQGQLRNVVVAHADPAKVVWAREIEQRYPADLSAPTGIPNVIRTGVSELYETLPDPLPPEAARDAEHRELLNSLGLKSVLIVPIKAHGQVLGAMSLIMAESGRHYDATDLALVEELASRAGAAIERARLFDVAQDAARRAEEANRIKDEFLATVSHELRTPLNAILGWATILRRDPSLDRSLAKGVEVIFRNARSQAKIVEDILDASRIITGKLKIDPKPTDLAMVIREATDVVRPSADAKGITIEFAAPLGRFLLVADPDRMQQVVWNLLSNAVKFTDGGGSVVIDVRRDEGEIVVDVSDTGRGIEADFLPFAFERFRQADSSTTRKYGGLGLGLAIVRHIVELHGGRVGVSSPGPGAGTRFWFALPIRAGGTLAAPSDRPVSHIADRPTVAIEGIQGVRVLVVDDDPDARELLGEILTSAGATVELAGSAGQAFASLEKRRPDVLVSDIGMPGEDGYSLMRRVRAMPGGAALPSIALTAYTRAEDRLTALAAGFTMHVTKPVDTDDLLAAISSLAALSTRRPPSAG